MVNGTAFVRQVSALIATCCVLAGFTLSVGCASKTSDSSLVFLNPNEGIDAVREQRRMMGLAKPSSGVWLDPRTDKEYREGHIPGAVHLPMQRIREEHNALREYSVIVVYGSDYNSPRATAASKTLLELGYDDVRTLRGGLKAWTDAGHSVESID